MAAPVQLLYSAADGTTLISSDDSRKQSFVVGSIQSCRYGDVFDPLRALETTSDGNWLLVDAKMSEEPEALDWLEEQISSLSQLLSSATPTTASGSSGLIIPADLIPGLSSSLPQPVDGGDDSTGGIAISCNSRAAFLRASSALDQIDELSAIGGTTETDSGILIPSGVPTRSIGQKAPFQTALVLPFDVMLWETVNVVKGLQQDDQQFYP
jgi:hypothetical protein